MLQIFANLSSYKAEVEMSKRFRVLDSDDELDDDIGTVETVDKFP